MHVIETQKKRNSRIPAGIATCVSLTPPQASPEEAQIYA
jgi:hypothetical protein